MFNKIKEKVNFNKVVVGSAVAVPATVATALPAFAASNDTVANLTSGMSGFISMCTTMLDTILGSPSLQIAFAASFAFLAVRLIEKLKKG